MHLKPLKQAPLGQSQTVTSALFSEEQPHAPTRHVLGKSPTPAQQEPVDTFPPVEEHCCSCMGVGLSVGRGLGRGLGRGVGTTLHFSPS